jgi:hypothetical protein
MAFFTRGASAAVGSSTTSPAPVSLYTVPASKKSVITGLTVANTTTFDLPINVWIDSGGTLLYIAKDLRVPPGEAQKLAGPEKMVLLANDVVKADGPQVSAGVPSFTVVVSVYEDV